MNLDLCTPGQREVVQTLDEPVMVAAGAGSGKTFTLTQRIVGALLPGADGARPYLDSMDQVLAITFTKKAAAELRSRIKGPAAERRAARGRLMPSMTPGCRLFTAWPRAFCASTLSR